MNENKSSGEPITDSELIDRYRKNGDKKALGQLFERYMDLAFFVAMGYLKNRASAEDAVQNAFIRVMNSPEAHFGSTGSAKAWLMRIVVNTCHNSKLGDDRRSKRHLAKASEQSFVYHPKEDTDDLSEHVAASMNQLPELYRLPVSLRFCENLSYKEISKILDRPEKTVQIQVSRGLEKMKSSITAAGIRVASVAITSALLTLKLEAAPQSLRATVVRHTLGDMAANNSLHNTAVSLSGGSKPALTFGKLALGIAILLIGTATILTLTSIPTDGNSTSSPSSTVEQKTSYHWSFEDPASTEVFEVLKGSWKSIQRKGVNGSNCMLTSRGSSIIKINIPLTGKPTHLSFQAKFYKSGQGSINFPTVGLVTTGIFMHHPEGTPSRTRWNRADIYFNEKVALVKVAGKGFLFSSIQLEKSEGLLLVTSGMWLLDDLHIEALSPQDESEFDPYLDLIHEHFSEISSTPTRFDIQIHDKKSSVYASMPKSSKLLDLDFSD